MNFDFSEEQRLLKDSAIEFCRNEIDPFMKTWLESRVFPRELLKKCGEIGWMGAAVQEEFGGSNLSEVSLGILSEIMGAHEIPSSIFLTIHFAKQLHHISNNEKKKNIFEKVVKGEMTICGAYTEPNCGSDAKAISSYAIETENSFVVNGEKSFITGPSLADIFIVSVITNKNTDPRKGMSLLLIKKEREGVEPYNLNTMATDFEGDFGGVYLTNVNVPKDNIIGVKDDGFILLMQELSTLRVHVALMMLGLAERCLNEAINYAKERKAFGKHISQFQAVSFRIAESWSQIQAAKLLAYKALYLADVDKSYSAESSAAKWYGCEVALQAISNSLQTLGAAGYTSDFIFGRSYRRARGMLIGDGTTDIQKLIIYRILFGEK